MKAYIRTRNKSANHTNPPFITSNAPSPPTEHCRLSSSRPPPCTRWEPGRQVSTFSPPTRPRAAPTNSQTEWAFTYGSRIAPGGSRTFRHIPAPIRRTCLLVRIGSGGSDLPSVKVADLRLYNALCCETFVSATPPLPHPSLLCCGPCGKPTQTQSGRGRERASHRSLLTI